MNAPEGIRRIATAIRWVGDGIGVVVALALGGMFLVEAQSLLNAAGSLGFAVVIGALISGCGRLLSWVIKGFAEPRSPGE